MEYIRVLQKMGTVTKILLCGGYTNSTRLTEAAALMLWLEAHAPLEWQPLYVPIDQGDMMSDLLEEARGATEDVDDVYICCRIANAPSVDVHRKRLYGERAEVKGFEYEPGSTGLRARAVQWLLHLPLEKLAIYFSSAAQLKRRIRDFNIKRAREAHAQNTS